MQSKSALGILFRIPEFGKVKSRLAAQLGDERALSLYKVMLQQTMQKAKDLRGVEAYGFYDGNIEAFDNQIGLTLYGQQGKDLGEKMLNAFIRLFALGFNRVCLIGSDSPTVPELYIYNALDLLSEYHLVLGPCQDGGYYLIGLKSAMPELFEGIPWGSGDVLSVTIKKAAVLNISYSMLPAWYDIDTPEDLQSWVGVSN